MIVRMPSADTALLALRFDRFELQPRERRLLAEGVPVTMRARALDLLLALVSRPGQVVTKSELLDSVWPDVEVEEGNLSVQMSWLRKVLGGALIATVPGRGYRFMGQVEAVPAVPAAGARPMPSEPPPPPVPQSLPTPRPKLIGREIELAELLAALSTAGLVTLTGPAGVGKTSLARALAQQAPGEAVWVDLAPLREGSAVLPAVARALGVPSSDGDAAGILAHKLGQRLLVLDNSEHVVESAAALVRQLFQVDASLRVMTTSQVPLAVSGERVHRLGPLALPLDNDTLDLHLGAVAMLVERVRAADHRFHPSPEHLPPLRDICRRLDGLPLALEMAAARVPSLGLAGVARLLEERFALLTSGRRDVPARHRTLQTALDWSHALLSPDEQQLYRMCSVFSGGFTLELMIAVSGGRVPDSGAAGLVVAMDDVEAERRWALIDLLAQLVDRSLVVVDDGDPPRYRLLETMRDDGRRRLVAASEEAAVRSRHLAALADIARRFLVSPRAHPDLRAALLAEHDNLREAVEWGVAHPMPPASVDVLNVVIAAAVAATFSSWRLDALRWLDACAPVAESPDIPTTLKARWLHERSKQWLMSGRTECRPMAEQALALYRAMGDEHWEFELLSNLVRAPGGKLEEIEPLCAQMRSLLARHPEWSLVRAFVLAGAEANLFDMKGDRPGVLRSRLQELELARRVGHADDIDAVETNVVVALLDLGRLDEALAMARGLIARLGDSDSGNAAYAWDGLLIALREAGQFAEFRAVAPRAARVLRLHGLPLIGPQCALLLLAEQRTADALRWIGHTRVAFAAAGMTMRPVDEATLDQAERTAIAELGAERVAAWLAEGAAMNEVSADRLLQAVGPVDDEREAPAEDSCPDVDGARGQGQTTR